MNNPASASRASIRFWHYWFPVLLLLIAITIFSTDYFSSDQTSRFIVPILKFFGPNMTAVQVAFWHHVIRKAAHVTEYFVLGMLMYRAIRFDVSSRAMVQVLTVVIVAAAAMMDEYHQSFVPSRTSSIIDVGFDCAGGLVAVLLMWIWHFTRTVEE